MLGTNHFFSFQKVQTPICPIFNDFCSHTVANLHTFGHGGSQCLSASHGGLIRRNLFLEIVHDAIVILKLPVILTVVTGHYSHNNRLWKTSIKAVCSGNFQQLSISIAAKPAI